MVHGRVMPDTDGRHPHATVSYVAQGYWETERLDSTGDLHALESTTYSLMLSVPSIVHANVLARKVDARSAMALVPWRDSGVGLLLAVAGAHAVFAVLDIAGHSRLRELVFADRRGQVFAGLITDADPNVVPMIRIDRFTDAMAEACTLRRLAAREVVQAVSEIRAGLRGAAGRAMLDVSPDRLESLTVNVVQPL